MCRKDRYPFRRRLGGPQSRFGCFGEEINLLPLRIPDRSACSLATIPGYGRTGTRIKLACQILIEAFDFRFAFGEKTCYRKTLYDIGMLLTELLTTQSLCAVECCHGGEKEACFRLVCGAM